jgi:hypothetical protein
MAADARKLEIFSTRSTAATVLLSAALLLSLASQAATMAELYQRVKKPCPPGCEQHGNCNFEEGRCECPWGYGGDDCSKLMMPACRQLEDSKQVSCDGEVPKNCACFK